MRIVGRKVKSVKSFNQKKTRKCVVRLAKMKTLPTQKLNKKSAVKAQSTPSVSKTIVKSTRSAGPTPLKKRILTLDENIKASVTRSSSVSSSSAASSPAPTPRVIRGQPIKSQSDVKSPETPAMAPKTANKKAANAAKAQDEKNEESPTVASGRSRRAIKPNPKYASEDIVTPKIMKQVTKGPKSGGLRKDRKNSQSSFDDFFNRDSSDDFEEFTIKTSGSAQNRSGDKMVDSDYDTIGTSEVKRRGRPKKVAITQSSTQKPLNIASNKSPAESATRVLSVSKSVPSQLQQLRRTLGSSTVSPLVSRKRKLDDNDDEISRAAILRRLQVKSSTPINRKAVSGQLPNGDSSGRKIIDTSPNEKRMRVSVPGGPMTGQQASSLMNKQKNDMHSKAVTNKGRSASPTTRTSESAKASPGENKNHDNSKNDLNTSPSSGIEDFETMPTFTIVNIHDIINKKGDVLISKTPQKRSDNADNEKPSAEKQQVQAKGVTESPKSGVKQVKITPDKIIQKPNRGNVRQTVGSGSADRTAPRILNSMVARKTAPVKPVIANLEDSTEDDDDSVSLNLAESLSSSDDEEEEVRPRPRQLRKKSSPAAKEISAKRNNIGNSSRSAVLRPAAQTLKKRPGSIVSAAAAKENLSGVTNRTPMRPTINKSASSAGKIASSSSADPTRRTTPDKVTISREGDKIVKKITCFETWYVINVPEDKPARIVRNSFEMPLIELANSLPTLKLPSEEWNTKVTLAELPPSILANKSESFIEYTGDLKEHKIEESKRKNYQPSAVLFRRAAKDRAQARMPYDRAVIFKNKSFSYNIDGRNIKMVAAPTCIGTLQEIETMLEIMDELAFDSDLVESTGN